MGLLDIPELFDIRLSMIQYTEDILVLLNVVEEQGIQDSLYKHEWQRELKSCKLHYVSLTHKFTMSY